MIPMVPFMVAFFIGCAWGASAHWLELSFWSGAAGGALIGLIVGRSALALEGRR